MSLLNSFVRGSRIASLAAGAPSRSSSSRQLAGAARAQYRQYSQSSSTRNSSSNARQKTPVAFGLAGLGGLGVWFGLGDKKDPKTTQKGMAGNHADVDYNYSL